MPVTWDFLGVESGTPTTGDPAAFFLINPPSGGMLTASVFTTGTFRLTNNSTGNVRIQSVTFDISSALLQDVVFDPFGEAGNDTGKPFTPDSGAVETGLIGHEHFIPHDGGFDVLKVEFSEFDPGEDFTFSMDIEPTSIKGSSPPGPDYFGTYHGMELTGSKVTILFSDGTTTQTQTFRTAGIGKASETTADTGLPAAPGLALVGSTVPPAIVSDPDQTLRITGPAGATAKLLQVEASLELAGVPGGGFDIDPFEANKAVNLTESYRDDWCRRLCRCAGNSDHQRARRRLQLFRRHHPGCGGTHRRRLAEDYP